MQTFRYAVTMQANNPFTNNDLVAFFLFSERKKNQRVGMTFHSF